MKRTQGYLLQHIVDTDYLLPYGQLIADHKRGVAVNETGLFIWNLLEQERSREELLREFLKEFLTDPERKDELEHDFDQFLNQLISLGVIKDDTTVRLPSDDPFTYLNIAGLTLSLSCPRELIDHSFLKYFTADTPDPDRIDQSVIVTFAPPLIRRNGTVLLRDEELIVIDRETDYLLLFPTLSQIREVTVSKDGANVIFHCIHPISEDLEYQFFHALRHVFLYLARKRGMYAIHSASILYSDRAWLFSASAGTGKSTHVNLWRELYQTSVLNGDLNLLAIEDGCPVIHGIPWCGTSETFDRRTLPLGGIVLLKRDVQDHVEELPADKKALLIMQRFISPMWTGEQLSDSSRFAEQLSGIIRICRLFCTKNPSAAEAMKGWIDGEQNDSKN